MNNKKLLALIVITLLLFLPLNVLALEDSFSKLQELIDNSIGEIVLDKDYSNLGTESVITITRNVTIDLNGHVINGKGVSGIFYVDGYYDLTIKDSNSNAAHTFYVSSDGIATIEERENTETIIVNGGCITGGDVTSGRTNKTKMNGKGSGIYINSGNLVINSGNIIGNRISDKFQYGAGIYAENNAIVTINGGAVSYNYSLWEGYGAGIYLDSSMLTVNNGKIDHNHAIYGGAIYARNNSLVTINNGTISHNKAFHIGGGISFDYSTVVINDGVIEYNEAYDTFIGTGGGINTQKGANLIITGGIIRENSAIRGGGIGTWTGGNIKIYGGTITKNKVLVDNTPASGSKESLGAGVYFNPEFVGYASEPSSLTLGRKAVITNNINTVTNVQENLYFENNQTINVGEGELAPQQGMNIGITMRTNGVFANSGSESITQYFKQDDTDYVTSYVDGKLSSTRRIYTYEIIKGNNQELYKGKIDNYSFEIDGDHSLFDSLEIEDLDLIKGTDYNVTKGSTIITFTSLGIAKLNTLDLGKYSFVVKYTNSKEVNGKLLIKEMEKNPNTGDNIIFSIILSSISLITLSIYGLYIYKKKQLN